MLLLIRLCVVLFPRAFRQEFGPSMHDMVTDEISRARVQGWVAAWWCALGTALNLTRAAAAERWRPTWTTGIANPSTKKDRTMQMLEHWLSDLRFAARSLARAPGFAAVTALTLALAIGANAAIFAAVNAVLINYPLRTLID